MTDTTADTRTLSSHPSARAMPRWIVTRQGLLRAVREVEVDGEPLMVYSVDGRLLVFRIAGDGCGHLEEVDGDLRRRALTRIDHAGP